MANLKDMSTRYTGNEMSPAEFESYANRVYQGGEDSVFGSMQQGKRDEMYSKYLAYKKAHPDEYNALVAQYDADPEKLSVAERGNKNAFTSLTDSLGLTDSDAAARAAKAAKIGTENANSTLQGSMQGVRDMFTDKDSDLWSLVDDQDTMYTGDMSSINKSQDVNWGELDAGDSANVTNYLNPKMDAINSQVAQAMRGQGGGALQSSGTNRAIVNAVADSTGKMWDTAYGQALTDSSNNQNIAKTNASLTMNNANLGQQQFENNTQPYMDWAQMEEDLAGLQYNGNMGITDTNVQQQGKQNTLF